MWGDALLGARRALSGALARAGTPPVAAGLVATAGLFHLATALAARYSSEGAADALATSPAFAVLGAAMVADAAAALAKNVAAPLLLRPRPANARFAGAALLHVAYASLAAAVAATFLARDEFRLWAAAGETFAGEPGQYLSRMPPRRLSSEPAPVRFAVGAVDPEIDRDGALRALSARLDVDGRKVGLRLGRPVWLGPDRFLRLRGFGWAPGFEILDSHGALVESEFVKLRLLPRGERDHLRSTSIPHRIYVEIPADETLRGGEAGLRDVTFRAEVWRGKVPVAEGRIGPGGRLEFEGLVARMPEVRYWVELEMVQDPGIPLLAAAAVAAAAGAAAWAFSLRRAETGGGGAGA